MAQTLRINDDFEEVGILSADDRNRITLGKFLKNFKRLKIYQDSRGEILLVPVVEIPASELWLYQNQNAMESIQRGLADAKAGHIVEKKPEDL
jgi:hypothetical protein